MPAPRPIPPELIGRPFTTAQAAAVGISVHVLGGRRFRQHERGRWSTADAVIDQRFRIDLALLKLPPDAAVSHVTALQVRGINVGQHRRLHFSTNTTAQTTMTDVELHRRRGQLWRTEHDGVPILGPDRTLIDAATQLGFRDLVRAGDWLVRLGLTTPDVLIEFCRVQHIDGVVRARRAATHVVAGSESVTETDVRLLLRFARLPVHEANGTILDDEGNFLARGDLIARSFKVLIEYDGWHHERDARQRQKDHLRRERLEAAGWTVIVITVEDMKNPTGIVRRVHRALVARGYDGPAPVMSLTWRQWFAGA